MHEIVKSECQLIIVLQSWVLVLVVGVVQTHWNKWDVRKKKHTIRGWQYLTG